MIDRLNTSASLYRIAPCLRQEDVQSAVVKIKRNSQLSSYDESVQTDYVLAEIGSSSEGDDQEK